MSNASRVAKWRLTTDFTGSRPISKRDHRIHIDNHGGWNVQCARRDEEDLRDRGARRARCTVRHGISMPVDIGRRPDFPDDVTTRRCPHRFEMRGEATRLGRRSF